MAASGNGAGTLLIGTSIDESNAVVVTVDDSGPGFGTAASEQLFKPFFTTKSNGMGLGLSICKSIVEKHGGKLTVAPRQPHGAAFRVVLPRFTNGAIDASA